MNFWLLIHRHLIATETEIYVASHFSEITLSMHFAGSGRPMEISFKFRICHGSAIPHSLQLVFRVLMLVLRVEIRLSNIDITVFVCQRMFLLKTFPNWAIPCAAIHTDF